jgi:hypothetical protein
MPGVINPYSLGRYDRAMQALTRPLSKEIGGAILGSMSAAPLTSWPRLRQLVVRAPPTEVSGYPNRSTFHGRPTRRPFIRVVRRPGCATPRAEGVEAEEVLEQESPSGTWSITGSEPILKVANVVLGGPVRACRFEVSFQPGIGVHGSPCASCRRRGPGSRCSPHPLSGRRSDGRGIVALRVGVGRAGSDPWRHSGKQRCRPLAKVSTRSIVSR